MENSEEIPQITSTSHPKNETDEWGDETSESETEPVKQITKPLNTSQGATKLRSWLNQPLRIEMTDKRVLVGIFFCTDRDANVILGSCSEYLPEDETTPNEEPRMLGLIMVPGKHIVSISIDQMNNSMNKESHLSTENALHQGNFVGDIV